MDEARESGVQSGNRSFGGLAQERLDIAYALGGGIPFADRQVERYGSLILAAEGSWDIPNRLDAAKKKYRNLYVAKGLDVENPPIAWVDFPALSKIEQKTMDTLAQFIKTVAQEMRQRYGVRLGAVFIDTMVAAGLVPPEKENDPGTMSHVIRSNCSPPA